jgi:hypothetical protein
MEVTMEGSMEASEFSLEEAMPPTTGATGIPASGVALGGDVPPQTGTSGMPSGTPPASAVGLGLDAPPMDTSGMPPASGAGLAPDAGAPADMLGSDLDVAVSASADMGAPPMPSPSQLGAPPGPTPSQLGGAPPASPSMLQAGMAPAGDMGAPPLSPSKLGAPPMPSASQLGAAAAPPEPAPPPYTGPSQTVARLSPIAVAKLVVIKGLKTAVEYPVYEGPNFIGRFDEKPVDIDITEQEDAEKPRASRQHACITWETTGLTIEDLNSSNGTFVNRNRVTPGEKRPLKNGDYIQTGNVLFQIKV